MNLEPYSPASPEGDAPAPDQPSAPSGWGTARFLNRELSWLDFNARVVEEAKRTSNPLLERVKFLAISGANLQEFLMVRVAGLKGQARARVETVTPDGRSVGQQLGDIRAALRSLNTKAQAAWRELKQALEAAGIMILSEAQLDEADRQQLDAYFESELLPVLTPISVDTTHPFPFIRNQGYALAFDLYQPRDQRDITGLLILPAGMPRFVALPPREGMPIRRIHIRDLLALYSNRLFPGFDVRGRGAFQLIRDGDLQVDDEAEDLVRHFESAIKRRQKGVSVWMTHSSNMPEALVSRLRAQFDLDAEDTTAVEGPVNLSNLFEIAALDLPALKFSPFEPRHPERVRDFDGDLFAAIRAKDFVVHHPFESFDVVVSFVRQAARDPHVVAIKMTLYRTSNDSPIVEALIDAAERGKSVTAMVELKARFDEEANLRWARDLERAGVQVVYGFFDLKIHAKIILVARRESGVIKTYAHFGTGNYHPNTAKVYTDLSMFTSDAILCRDAGQLFNFMTSYARPQGMERLRAAPLDLRETLLEHISREAEAARAGRPSAIWLKANALVDTALIDALYEASQAGVPIRLLIRGICCLRPGVPGLSETIEVKSIVGRFLEHHRIYVFGNGAALPSDQASCYFSSADLMPRNLNRRVETLVPVRNDTVRRQIVAQIMAACIADSENSWLMQNDGRFERESAEPPFSTHAYFMENPSLSGRGSAKTSGSRLPAP